MSDQHNTVAFTDVVGPTQGKTGARFKWSFTVRADNPEELIDQLHYYEDKLIKAGCIPFDAYVDQRRNQRNGEPAQTNGQAQTPPPPPNGTQTPPAPNNAQTPQTEAVKTGTGKLICLTIKPGNGGKMVAEFQVDGLQYPLKDSRGPDAIASLFDPVLNWEAAHFSKPAVYTELDFGTLWIDWAKPAKYYNVVKIHG